MVSKYGIIKCGIKRKNFNVDYEYKYNLYVLFIKTEFNKDNYTDAVGFLLYNFTCFGYILFWTAWTGI